MTDENTISPAPRGFAYWACHFRATQQRRRVAALRGHLTRLEACMRDVMNDEASGFDMERSKAFLQRKIVAQHVQIAAATFILDDLTSRLTKFEAPKG